MDKGWLNIFTVNKKSSPKAPDYRGTLTIDDDFLSQIASAPRDAEGRIELEFSGWNKVGPKAGNYISGSVQKPYKSAQQNGGGSGFSAQQKADNQPLIDDDIPWD